MPLSEPKGFSPVPQNLATNLIIDAHLDLAWNALSWNRDLHLKVAQMRTSEAGIEGKSRGRNTVSFPQMREGRVGVSMVTLLARANPEGRSILDFRNQQSASAAAQGQLAWYRLLEEEGVCHLINDLNALRASTSAWKAGSGDAPLGFILSMEGADPIISPSHAEWWYRAGLRAVGLAHYGPSAYANGTACEGGLFPAGRELLRAMEELGMILDLTHLADEAFWEAAKLFRGPVLASHNNCRAITPHQRQFSDDQIRLLIERDAVIGTALDAWMLVPGWTQGTGNGPRVTLESAVEHIDHICQIAGTSRHCAIGSDLDGGFGTEQGPEDLDTIADLQSLGPLLAARGYSAEDVEGIFHGNWLRFFERAWA
ncbi:MAG: membrane dipeptidase [Acidobacteriota bacterium]|nr:membrane dipeptidase [Acidobacteriota bacterium]